MLIQKALVRQRTAQQIINYEWPLEQLTEVDRCCIGQTPVLVTN